MYIKVLLIKKACNIDLKPSKHEKQVSLMGLFLCLSRISLRQYCLKNPVKSWGLEKIYKGGITI